MVADATEEAEAATEFFSAEFGQPQIRSAHINNGDRKRIGTLRMRISSWASMLREALEQAIAEAEKIAARDPKFAARAEALALLEMHLTDSDDITIPPDLRTIETRGRSLQRELGASNALLVREIRQRIASKNLAGPALARALLDHAGPPNDDYGYDALDLLVGMILDAGEPTDLRAPLTAEMVAYQPTPARAILEAIDRAQIDSRDVLCDLGSGLGWVVILTALVTGARCIGIELEPAYVEAAVSSARALNVANAEFVEGDLLETSLDHTTIYFSYTPLRGALMQKLIARLHDESRRRPIRVCTLGPCTNDFLAATWLVRSSDAPIDDREITSFHSVS